VIRTRLTWLVYVQLALYAYVLYGFGPSVALLRRDLGFSHTVGGLYATALAGGAVVAGLVGRRAVDRLGRGRLLWSAVAGMCAGLVGFCTARTVPLTMLAAMVCGTFGAWVVNTANAALMDGNGPRGTSALTEANALAASAGVAAPLLIGGCVWVGLGWRVALMLVLGPVAWAAWFFRGVRLPPPVALMLVLGPVAWAAWFFRGVRLPPPRQGTDTAQADGGETDRWLPAAYWVTWAVLACVIGIEFCLSVWAAELLGVREHLSPGAAAAVWSTLLVGVAVSRLVASRLTAQRPVDSVLTAGLVILLVGFGLFWVTTTAWVAALGLVIVGAGLGVQYPLTIARAITLAPGRSDLASARAGLAAGLAVGAGPFLLGALADHYGSHAAFLMVPVLAVLALAGLGVSRAAAGSAAPPTARLPRPGGSAVAG